MITNIKYEWSSESLLIKKCTARTYDMTNLRILK